MLKLQFQDRKREAIWLVDEKFTVGRHSTNSLMLDDAIADFQAEIRVSENKVTLVNLEPANAITLNGLIIDGESAIKSGDNLCIGKTRLLLTNPNHATSAPPELPSTQAWSINSTASWIKQNHIEIKDELTIGRDTGCDLCLPLEHLSRQHAKLSIRSGLLYLTDLDSANGSFVNGERIKEQALKPGDKIKLDLITFTVDGPSNNHLDPHKTIIRKAPTPPAPAPAKKVQSQPNSANQGGNKDTKHSVAKPPKTQAAAKSTMKKEIAASKSSKRAKSKPKTGPYNKSKTLLIGLSIVMGILCAAFFTILAT
jgi:pSer/pThr/pTyr-binding forkhead associated (FHA) protein